MRVGFVGGFCGVGQPEIPNPSATSLSVGKPEGRGRAAPFEPCSPRGVGGGARPGLGSATSTNSAKRA
uniref:Uncharacterized protein n=1 Tax=Arundo donax TaxID=35708 RepID=A0A0A9TPY1_ARUDO